MVGFNSHDTGHLGYSNIGYIVDFFKEYSVHMTTSLSSDNGVPMRFETRALLEEAGKRGIAYHHLGKFSICKILGKIWMVCNPKDRTIALNIIRDGFWEAWVTTWMFKNIQPGSSVLDIGANIGYYTLLLAENGCHVTAIEPQEENCNMLSASIVLNDFKTVTIVRTALGNTRGIVPFNVSSVNNGCSSIVREGQHTNDTIMVPITTLDTFEEHFDFIKIDAEGAEHDIWYGALSYFEKNQATVIILEWLPSRYPSPAVFAKDILDRCHVSYINEHGDENPVVQIERMLLFTEEIMLVLRFKK